MSSEGDLLHLKEDERVAMVKAGKACQICRRYLTASSETAIHLKYVRGARWDSYKGSAPASSNVVNYHWCASCQKKWLGR
jgi:hypothetical protein